MSSNRGTRAKLRIVGARPADQCNDAPDACAAPATAEEAERIRLELEMAQERRQMRRELAAKLVAEYRIRPTTIPVRALRTALVDRDLTEEECERLRVALAKADRGTSATPLGNDRKDKPR